MAIPRTLGLSKNRSNCKSKGRRTSAGAAVSSGTVGRAGTSTQHTGGGSKGEAPLSDSGLPGLPLTSSCSFSTDERPSSEPLGAGVRVYTCLFDAVGQIIQVRTQLLRAVALTISGDVVCGQRRLNFGRVLICGNVFMKGTISGQARPAVWRARSFSCWD